MSSETLETNNEYIHKDKNDKWIYYCTLIPGYVEKYGTRGIRERNQRFLKKMKRQKTESDKKNIRTILFENNLPLAKYTAEKWRIRNGLTREQAEDDFQECCIALSEYTRNLGEKKDDLIPSHFMTRAYYHMLNVLYVPALVKKTFENSKEFTPFEEESHTPEQEENNILNLPLLKTIGYVTAGKRNTDILLDYFLGDIDKYIEPGDAAMIGDKYHLTASRIYEIRDKTVGKIQKFIRYLFNNEVLQYEDFFL